MIQFIAEMVSWTYDVRSDAIVISKSGEPLLADHWKLNFMKSHKVLFRE